MTKDSEFRETKEKLNDLLKQLSKNREETLKNGIKNKNDK